MMESPTSNDVELPPVNHPAQHASTPHYVISPQDVIVDRNAPLQTTGRSDNVFKGSWSNGLVVVKILSNDTPANTWFDRVKCWQSLRHVHVLQVFGVSPLDAEPLFIISQYHPNGNATEFLVKNPATDRAKLMFECALGMQYLHERGITHGNLKPTNILVTENGQACVADYGMIDTIRSGGGCARYFSPEAWKGTISTSSDVFAFAISSYEIFTSTPPWGLLSEDDIYRIVVREGNRPDRPEPHVEQEYGLTDNIWGIIEASWHEEATLRPTFNDIVEMWRTVPEEDNSGMLQPTSPSTGVAGSSSGQRSSVDYSQSTDAGSMESMPPAYSDVPKTIYPPGSRGVSWQGAPLDDQARKHAHFTSVTEGDSLSFSPPASPTNTSRSANDLSPRRASTISETNMSTSNPPIHLRRQASLATSISTIRTDLPDLSTIDEAALVSPQYRPPSLYQDITLGGYPAYAPETNTLNQTQRAAHASSVISQTRPISGGTERGAAGTTGSPNAVLLAGALHAEVTEGRKQDLIDNYLRKIQVLSSQSAKEAQKLVTAGVVPTVILLLKSRAVDGVRLEVVLTTLGILAFDPITANTIHRTHTTSTLIAIIESASSDAIISLSIWCISRICRSSAVAASLVKQGLARILVRKCLKGTLVFSRYSAWCLGMLAYTDDLAETLATHDVVKASVDHLRYLTADPSSGPADICAAIYVIARMARTIPLSKSLSKAGCVPLIVHHLSTSEDPQVLHWSSRAVGCLQRPNAVEIAKALLDAGCATALARLPRVLPSDVIEPLGSFAFAIQRLSCAEWGGGTRKALVEAGVVDSLLSALRTSADIPYPQVHIDLALAISFLGDVGGTSVRKEIVNAGGIDILKRVGAAGRPEVAKACNVAVTTITGNLLTRSAASAKTAMSHNWSGGCPEYQADCPFISTVD